MYRKYQMVMGNNPVSIGRYVGSLKHCKYLTQINYYYFKRCSYRGNHFFIGSSKKRDVGRSASPLSDGSTSHVTTRSSRQPLRKYNRNCSFHFLPGAQVTHGLFLSIGIGRNVTSKLSLTDLSLQFLQIAPHNLVPASQ